MGKILTKVKSVFFTQTPSIDNGLFGAPDPLAFSKLPARYHPEDRPHNRREPTRHNSSSSSLDVPSFNHHDYIPYDPPGSLLETNYIQPTNPFGMNYHHPSNGATNFDLKILVSSPPSFRPSAHIAPQASPISQSSFHQHGNDNLTGQALNSNNDPNVITLPHRLNQRGVSAPVTLNRDTSIGLVGQPSLPINAASQRHVSAPDSTLDFAAAQFARLHPSSPGSLNTLNTQRQSALGPAAQPEPCDMPTLKACNICLDSHPPTEVPARPITSTCTHRIDNTCKIAFNGTSQRKSRAAGAPT